MRYIVTVNDSRYRDVPPMSAYGPRDLRDLIDELKANGINVNRIKVKQDRNVNEDHN